MLSVWCLVPGNYPTARRLRPLRSLIEDRTIAEKSIDLILSRYLFTDSRVPGDSAFNRSAARRAPFDMCARGNVGLGDISG